MHFGSTVGQYFSHLMSIPSGEHVVSPGFSISQYFLFFSSAIIRFFSLLLPCSLVLWFNVLRLTSQLHKLPWQVALPESPLQVICWYRFFLFISLRESKADHRFYVGIVPVICV